MLPGYYKVHPEPSAGQTHPGISIRWQSQRKPGPRHLDASSRTDRAYLRYTFGRGYSSLWCTSPTDLPEPRLKPRDTEQTWIIFAHK